MSRPLFSAEPSQNGTLTTSQVKSWRERGFAFVSGLIPQATIDTLRDAALEKFPAPDTQEAQAVSDFGSNLNFPSRLPGFNDVTLHPNVMRAISDLLGVRPEETRLTQSNLWSKYGRRSKAGIQDNSDQRIHVDYPNHTLAHPSPWDRPEAVELILYLSDWEETGGSTAVVPREGPDDPAYRWPIVDSPGIGNLRYINDRPSAEEYFGQERPHLAHWRRSLYDREVLTKFKRGDIIFYRHDTWHRGTPMREGTLRLVHNITYRRADAEWISTLHVGWAWKAYRDDKYLERLIATSSLTQRAVLGFPQPGSPYWCAETIAAVEARYGMFGMDMKPYRDALPASDH